MRMSYAKNNLVTCAMILNTFLGQIKVIRFQSIYFRSLCPIENISTHSLYFLESYVKIITYSIKDTRVEKY